MAPLNNPTIPTWEIDAVLGAPAVMRRGFWDGFEAAAATVSSNEKYSNVFTAGTFNADPTTGRTRWLGGASTTTGGGSGLRMSGTTFTPRSAENWRWRSLIQRTQAGAVDATGVLETNIGLRANFTTGQQDGIYWRNVRTTGGVTNWTLVCRNAGVESTVDSGIAVDGTERLLEFLISQDGASVQGYIDGNAVGAPITTNIPTGQLNPVILSNNRTANITTSVIYACYGWGVKGDEN